MCWHPRAYLTTSNLAARRMRDAGGHIVNIGSPSAEVRDGPHVSCVAAKSAVPGFSEALRKTRNPNGIKVTLIEPGFTAIPMIGAPAEDKARRQQEFTLLEPEGVAAVLFCLSQPRGVDIPLLQIQPHR